MNINERDISILVKKTLRNLQEAYKFYQKPIPHYSPNDKLELINDPNVKEGGNFSIKRNGVVYWVSRSNTISLYVYCKDSEGEWNILASQRGPKAKFSGKWNVVCGFLDYGETLENAAVRECWEETGIKIDSKKLTCLGTSSSRVRDAVNTSYYCVLNGNCEDYKTSILNSEDGEVSQARWIKLSDVPNFNWGKSHEKNILSISKKIDSNSTIKQNVVNLLSQMVKSGELTSINYKTIINILENEN